MGNLAASPTPAAPPLLVRTAGSEHRLDGGPAYRIGRDHDADIVLTDTRVSLRHAVLLADGPTRVLEDRSSRNGTFLDAKRTSRVEIRGNCVFRLGHPQDGAELRFEPRRPRRPGRPAGPGQPSAASTGRASTGVPPRPWRCPPGSYGSAGPRATISSSTT